VDAILKKLLALLIFLLPVKAFSIIGFDASSSATGTATFSWTHTVVGTPKGAFVFVMEDVGVTDVISGVTYGGTAMTRINRAADTAGEPGSCYAYFLGASIPTGNQTVQVTVSSGTTAKFGVAFTVTAGSNTQTSGTASCTVSADVLNPSCSVTGISGASYGAAGLYSGQNAPSSIAAGSGFTIGPTNDYGSQSAGSERRTTQQASGNETIAFTVASDDVAMVGVAIEQTVPDVVTCAQSIALLGVGCR
jgi:hypothetical protein